MATVTIANLIHRAEWDGDVNEYGRTVGGLYWEGAIPVCECGEDMTDGREVAVTYRRGSYAPLAECQSCQRTYPILETYS